MTLDINNFKLVRAGEPSTNMVQTKAGVFSVSEKHFLLKVILFVILHISNKNLLISYDLKLYRIWKLLADNFKVFLIKLSS
jgi:hypothetical protein